MRELKFRVWDNVDYMSSPFTLFDLQTRRIEFTDYVIVMQFTGLKDKNGVEIYEGDILKYTAHNGYNLFPGRLTIKWIPESACFGYSHSDQSFTPNYVSPFSEHDELETDVLNYSEVIGNIYQHPDLIT